MAEKEISIEIKNVKLLLLILVLFGILFLELRVSLNTPIVFGDEGYHTRMAQWIYKHKEYPVWNPFEGTNLARAAFERPPLWNILEASLFLVTGFHEFTVKFFTPFIATVLTGTVIFVLGKRIFDENTAFIASIVATTIPSFVTYSVLFYTDILAVFYFTLFALTLILYFKEGEKKYWIVSSVFAGLSLLTKRTGIVVFPIMLFVFLFEIYRKRDFDILKNYILFFILFFLISGSWLLRDLYYFNTPICIPLPFFSMDGCKKTFEYGVKTDKDFEGRTAPTGTEVNVFQMGIINYVNFAFGIKWFVPLLFFCGMYLVLFEKSIQNNLLILMLASFLILFYTIIGRAEDVARYTLSVVPLVSIVVGVYLGGVFNFIQNHYKTAAFLVFIFVLVLGLMNLNGKLVIMKAVKGFSPTFFQACDWIRQNTDEDALLMSVWGHRLVYNCQRDAAGYSDFPDSRDIILGDDLNLTLSRLEAHGITHIFLQKFSISNQAYHENYPTSFVQFLQSHPENFVNIYENGPPIQQCLQQGGCDGNILYEINYTVP